MAMLAGCSSLNLVEDYDAQIEQSLNDYHKSFISFVTRMEQTAGTEAGSYGGEDARTFYSESAGVLANLVVRAEAKNPQGQCFASSRVANGVSAVLVQSVDYFEQNKPDHGPVVTLSETVKQSLQELNDGTSDLATGSCTVVVLKALKLNHAIFQAIHEHNRYLRPPASTIGSDLISQAVEMAIITEQSKKP